MRNRRGFSKPFRSVASTFLGWERSVLWSAQSRIGVAAWLASLASKKIFDQVSLLEQTITTQGHLGMFPPKFHCELNPIKMVCIFFSRVLLILMLEVTQYWGWCKGRYREVHKVKFEDAKRTALEYSIWMLAQKKSSNGSSIAPGGLCMLIDKV